MLSENQDELTPDQDVEAIKAPESPLSQKERVEKRQGKRKRTPPGQRSPLDEVLARFAACGRCVYFLLSYQSLAGREVLETAVAAADDQWLQLPWVKTIPTLVEKSFGLTIDWGDFYVEAVCPLCQRAFVYTAETEEQMPDFQIEL